MGPVETEVDEHPFTCQFCAQQDPSFSNEGLDIHYWKDCPMLIQCEYCQQVIEIATLRDHYLTECEGKTEDVHALEEGNCPLCQMQLQEDDDNWRDHLLSSCVNNPRRK